MSPSVVIEGGALLLDIEGLGYTPLEPACLLVEHRYLVLRELVLMLLEVLTDVRGWVPMLSKAAVERPSSFPHIVGFTVVTLHLVHHSAFMLFVNLVLRVNKATSDGVGGFQMYRNSCLMYAPGKSVR